MAHDNSAPRAQREGFARLPTGFRRLTPGLLKADRTADGFAGLPDSVTTPGQVLAALKAAAPRLGIAPRLVHAVDWLFRFTQAQDWEEGSRPIVWPSASMQQEALGLSASQVKETNRCLIELGLVTMKDSPNGKRYGRRHEKTGRILEAYGFDLAPVAMRYAEFMRLAGEAKAERAALGRLRRRATIARKAIAQILETAQEYGFEGEEWPTLERETQALTRALRSVERVDEMETGVTSLERRQTAARERLETLLGVVDSTPKEPENRPHIYNYKSSLDPKQDTVIAAKECSERGEGPVLQSPASGQRQRLEKSMVHGIRPDELPRLAPKLKPYLRRPDPTWPDIVEAADWLRGDLGVSKSLWPTAVSPWAANWQRSPWRSSPPRSRGISPALPAVTSTAWSPKPRPVSCISTARCGRCGARSIRNATSGAGEGRRTAVTPVRRCEPCRWRSLSPLPGRRSSICGLPTVHSGASGVRLSPPSKDRAAVSPAFPRITSGVQAR
jgi:replication initiation protein RepC